MDKRQSLVLSISATVFGVSLYYGMPNLIKSEPPKAMLASATLEQRKNLEMGDVSSRLLNYLHEGNVVTLEDFSKYKQEEAFPAIFPPNLLFRDKPKLNDSEKEKIILAQKISLLENKISALETEISILHEPKNSTIKWSISQMWAFFIWTTGVVFTVILKYFTEKVLRHYIEKQN